MHTLYIIFRSPLFIRCVRIKSQALVISEPSLHLIHRYTKHTGQDIRVSIRVNYGKAFNPIVLQILREPESPLKVPTLESIYLIPHFPAHFMKGRTYKISFQCRHDMQLDEASYMSSRMCHTYILSVMYHLIC